MRWNMNNVLALIKKHATHSSIKNIKSRINGINSNLSFIFVHRNQAFKEMEKLDGNKAGEKKSKSIKIIKKNIDIIYYTLYYNFLNSLFFSEFPSKLKEGDIAPIYKKEDIYLKTKLPVS